MQRKVFDVLPYGDQWSVSSGGEPLIVAASRDRAEQLAGEAAEALGVPRRATGEGRYEVGPDESRSFAPKQRR